MTAGIVEVDVAKVNRPHLVATMLAAGLAAGEKEPIEKLVKRAAKHYDRMGENDLGACDQCRGVSPLALPACAFCGIGEDGPPEAGGAPPGAAPGPEANALVPRHEAVRARRAATPRESVGSIPHSEKPWADLVRDPRELNAVDPELAEYPLIRGHALIGPAAIEAAANQTEADLDEAVRRIQAAKGEFAASGWRLGRMIAGVYDSHLWQLRQSADGKPRYKSFEAFVREELKMSREHAYELMRTAKAYDEGKVAELGGMTKAAAVLMAPPEERERLETMAESGASVRELSAEATKAKGGKPRPPKPKPVEPPPPAPKLGAIWIRDDGKLPLTKRSKAVFAGEIPFENKSAGHIEVTVRKVGRTHDRYELHWRVTRNPEEEQ
jgi:hypothetical protein